MILFPEEYRVQSDSKKNRKFSWEHNLSYVCFRQWDNFNLLQLLYYREVVKGVENQLIPHFPINQDRTICIQNIHKKNAILKYEIISAAKLWRIRDL